jgi:hypothetical protein
MATIFQYLLVLFLSFFTQLLSQTCQSDAQANLLELANQEHYGWCAVNDELEEKITWFDSGRSFAFASWLNPRIWTNKRINFGQTFIMTAHAVSFIGASVIANIFVLIFHFSHSPHPKFSFTFFSRSIIRLHIYTGAIGVVLPLYVFFGKDEYSGGIAMLVFCIVDYVFALTARIQAPNVYGVRNLTVPLYNSCILLKAIINTCLLQSLLLDPIGGYKTKVQWLWICWVLHQTYAWVRVWYVFFVVTETMSSHRYTISVMLAGFMCINYSVGFIAVMISLVVVILHYLWLDARTNAILKRAQDELKKNGKISSYTIARAGVLATMWDETKLDTFTNRPHAAEHALQRCIEMKIDPMNPNVANNVLNSTKAKFLFDTINITNSGHITLEELGAFFMEFGVKETTKAALMMFKIGDENKNNTIELEEFEKHFSAFYIYAFDDLMKAIQNANRTSNRNKLHELAMKERKLRLESIRLCPFLSFRNNQSAAVTLDSMLQYLDGSEEEDEKNDLDQMRSISNSSFRLYAKAMVEGADDSDKVSAI